MTKHRVHIDDLWSKKNRGGSVLPTRMNIDKCKACGTANPTLFGETRAVTCSGCGTPLPVHEPSGVFVSEADFTPKKIVRRHTRHRGSGE